MSGVLLVILSPLLIGMNSIVFVTCSSILGIGVVSVVFGSILSMLCSGVAGSVAVAGTFFCLFNFFFSLQILVTSSVDLINLKVPQNSWFACVGVCLFCVDI